MTIALKTSMQQLSNGLGEITRRDGFVIFFRTTQSHKFLCKSGQYTRDFFFALKKEERSKLIINQFKTYVILEAHTS
jgi:hypothetical protein